MFSDSNPALQLVLKSTVLPLSFAVYYYILFVFNVILI